MEYQRGLIHTVEYKFLIDKKYFFNRTICRRNFNNVAELREVFKYEEDAFKVSLHNNWNRMVVGTLTVDLLKIVDNTAIDESNIDFVIIRIKRFLGFRFSGVRLYKNRLNRVDLCIDLLTKQVEQSELFDIVSNKTPTRAITYLKNNMHLNTVYFNGKGAKKGVSNNGIPRKGRANIVLRVYKKNYQSVGIKEFEDNTRFEITLNRRKLAYYKNKCGIEIKLENYAQTQFVKGCFLQEYQKVLGKSDYWRMDSAISKIENSGLSEYKKKAYIEILTQISSKGIDKVRQETLNKPQMESIAKKMTKCKYDDRKKGLDKLNINLITLNKDSVIEGLENPINIIKRI